MIRRFRSYLAPRTLKPSAAIPEGQRAYAIGDVHGRLDLFTQLMALIEADDAERGPADTTIVLLGDLIDRGPDSAGVVDAARAWGERRRVRAISGNHEEMLLKSFERLDTLRHFLRYGGRETILSYSISRELYEQMSHEELRSFLPNLIPAEHIAYFEAMEDRIAIGDYLFVHAGIRPGVPFEEQKLSDLRWIRETFIDDTRDHGAVIVHGHTISDEVEEMPNRIGIDTGAFMSGRLTALGLEGTSRWYLTATEANAAAA